MSQIRKTAEPTSLGAALAEIRQLKKKNELLESLFHRAPAIYRIIDENGNLIACNDAYERWTERPRSEIVGQSVYSRHTEEQRKLAELTDRKILEDRKPIELVETFDWHGQQRHLVTLKAPIDFEGVTCITCISIDRTQTIAHQQDLQQELSRYEQASDIRDRLLMILGHDVRSPIATLVSLCDGMLLDGIGMKPENVLEVMDSIGSHSRNVLTLIDDMLTWVRTQQQRLDPQLQSVSVSELTERSAELYQKPLAEKSLEIIAPDDGPDTVFADKDMLEIVLRNFLSNAIKFTPKNGTIRIEREEFGDDEVRVSVIDSGRGISPEKAQLLNMSESLSKTSGTEKEEGLGLGLSLCKELADRMNGKIVMEPINPGTRASIYLPRVSLDSDLVRLVYRSEATEKFDEDGLIDIAQRASENNVRLNISGFLLHGNGTFLQLLEGQRTVIDDLMKRLIQDERHRDVLVLLHEPIRQKLFPEWDMLLLDDGDKLDVFKAINSETDADDRMSLDIIDGLIRSSGLTPTPVAAD